jgi:hypothetical protein
VELPSVPDIVIKLQKTLSDENVTNETVVRVVGSEPMLAGKLMNMAIRPRSTGSGPQDRRPAHGSRARRLQHRALGGAVVRGGSSYASRRSSGIWKGRSMCSGRTVCRLRRCRT